MVISVQDTYLQTVLDSFERAVDNTPLAYRTFEWFTQKDEAEAKIILDLLPKRPASSKSEQRYRFPSACFSKRDELIQEIFRLAYSKNPQGIAAAAERVVGTSFYPLSNRVCFIYLPRFLFMISGMLTVLSIAGFALPCLMAYRITRYVGPYLLNTAFPFLEANIPSLVTGVAAPLSANPLATFVCVLLAKQLILSGPKIPYLTAAAKAVDLRKIIAYVASVPAYSCQFIVDTFFKGILFFPNKCLQLNEFFDEKVNLGKEARNEALQLGSQEAWRRIAFPQAVNP